MRLIDSLLGRAWAYRLWQRPFADQKFRPIDPGDIEAAGRVLDVGCGPGTNADRFAHAEYLGIDLNPEYIEEARARHPGRFEVGDATALRVEGPFDFILANSLFHHLDEDATEKGLRGLARLLDPDGRVHILDLVLPGHPGPARALARLDRGRFARPLEAWREVFCRHFTPERFEPYRVRGLGLDLWHMVYFKGGVRR